MADTAAPLARFDEVNAEIAELIEGFRSDLVSTVRGFALSMSDLSVNGSSAFSGNWQDVGPLQDKCADIVLALIMQDPRFTIPRNLEHVTDVLPSASMQLIAHQVRMTP